MDRISAQRQEDEADFPRVRATCIHLALATAARLGALLDMTWPQVRFETREIWLGKKPNGKKRATVPMNDTITEVLEHAASIRTTGHVIEYNGAPVKSLNTAWRKCRARAGFPELHFHDLRHTAAVWMAAAGVPIPQIAQYLGHSNPQVTYAVYARYAPEHAVNAAGTLELLGTTYRASGS